MCPEPLRCITLACEDLCGFVGPATDDDVAGPKRELKKAKVAFRDRIKKQGRGQFAHSLEILEI